MTTRDALLADILAKSDDDLPRLVYADWLEENGEPERANVIRCHIEAAKKHPSSEVTGRTQYVTTDGVEASEFFKLMAVVTAWTSDPDKNGLCGVLGELAGRNNVVWERGFVAEVRCTLDDWCGGECHQCAGTGRSFPIGGPSIPCRRCGGSLVTGIGPEVVRRHPVERVVLVDRNPVKITLGPWAWADETTVRDIGTFAIPKHLFDLLKGGKEEHYGEIERPERIMTYEHREDANYALSSAIIRWAKSQPHPARIVTSPVAVDFLMPAG